MRPIAVRSALSAALLVLAPGAGSRASLPEPPNAQVPACITLVGRNGGVPSDAGTFIVVIRDLAGSPVPGAVVTLDLSLATDVSLCADAAVPGLVLDCPDMQVMAVTDAAGIATFTVPGGGNATGERTFGGAGRFYWDGVVLGSPVVRTFDLDGAEGLGANDLSLWLEDFGTGQPFARSDYDCSGVLGANDLSLWLSAFGQGTQTASCATICP